jgi:hypothetical protein
MSNKKIDINPELFTIGGSLKTRKKRENKTNTSVPLISPNVLKNKLLQRIKEHKKKETENLVNNKKKLPDNINNTISTKKPNLVDLESYTDEFNDSIHYLQSLSKQKQIDEQKEVYEKKKKEIEQKTIKNYHAMIAPQINIELPEALQEPLISVNTSQLQPLPSDPPYGCLKNGVKPTYKHWNKTHKNTVVTNNDVSVGGDSNISPTIHVNSTEREMRLNSLKNKIKEKKIIEQMVNNAMNPDVNNSNMATQNAQVPINNTSNNNNVDNNSNNNNNNNNNNNVDDNLETSNIQTIKQTIRKKYTLGKFRHKNSVGILLKDRDTRKKVLTAHRELKKKSMNDIKSYLREHNLIKVGSNAPNDVVRKIFESSMLAGEITNQNTDTLLHNLMKDDKEL